MYNIIVTHKECDAWLIATLFSSMTMKSKKCMASPFKVASTKKQHHSSRSKWLVWSCLVVVQKLSNMHWPCLLLASKHQQSMHASSWLLGGWMMASSTTSSPCFLQIRNSHQFKKKKGWGAYQPIMGWCTKMYTSRMHAQISAPVSQHTPAGVMQAT